MKVIAHRGYWLTQAEKNTKSAFERAFDLEFGVETDIRDFQGKLVIAHDIAQNTDYDLDDFLRLYKSKETNVILALNIKADGLQNELMKKLRKYNIKNYFLFDMSVPEMVVYNDMEFSYYTRQSDIEQQCVLYEKANGVWLDTFYGEWDVVEAIKMHLQHDKAVCLVSPELHGKNNEIIWRLLKTSGLYKNDKLYICTDVPEEAISFFSEGK